MGARTLVIYFFRRVADAMLCRIKFSFPFI